MSVPHAFHTVTVVRPTVVDRRGTKVPDWNDAEEIELSGCCLQERSTMRDFDGRVLSVSEGFILFAPLGANIQAGDRVKFGGVTYEVNGIPSDWPCRSGRISHVEVLLSRWAG